ncbi:MAG: acyl--CoA ligase, partial [Chloroflexota bacterium]
MPVGNWLERRAMLSPNKVALIDTINSNQVITYRQWNRKANRMANFLQERVGIQKGDRVAVLSFNCTEYLDIWFALGKLGAILQNLNWRQTAAELSTMIAETSPKALVYGEEHCPTVNSIRSINLIIPKFIAIGEKAATSDLTILEAEDFPDTPPKEVELDWDDPWVICYTGGTSGIPKGAVLTYRSIT